MKSRLGSIIKLDLNSKLKFTYKKLIISKYNNINIDNKILETYIQLIQLDISVLILFSLKKNGS